MSNETNTFTVRGTFEKIDVFTTKNDKQIITLVLGTDGERPQLIPIKCFGRMAGKAKECQKGDMVEVTGKLGGRDWNGKIYGENVAETIEVVGGKQAAEQPASPPPDESDLPF